LFTAISNDLVIYEFSLSTITFTLFAVPMNSYDSVYVRICVSSFELCQSTTEAFLYKNNPNFLGKWSFLFY